MLDGNAVIDGDRLGPREAAREHGGQQQNSIPHGVPHMLTDILCFTLRPMKLYHRLYRPILDSINTLIVLSFNRSG